VKKITPSEVITQKGHIRYLESLRMVSKINRNRPTRTENIFWYEVLSENKVGYKFTRQKPINRFVLDFYCSKLLMAIEIDGCSHDNKIGYDQERDNFLSKLGIITIRYSTNEVLDCLANLKLDLILKIRERENILSSPVKGRCPPG